MKITCCTQDGRATEIEVGEAATFGDIKITLAVEFKTTPENMILSFKGDTGIPDEETVGSQGLAENDMLLAVIKPSARAQRAHQQAQGQRQAQAQSQGHAQGQRRVVRPPNDPFASLLPHIFSGMDLVRVFAPPSNVQAEEEKKKNQAKKIDENFAQAMEESPESFASVYMLYIDVEINGVPVKAFVDSGAQSTVMSKACAERTGVIGIVDPRFAGVAVGVGQARILGRVHFAPVKIGDNSYNCSFSVLDQVQNVDLLIGLDMLKKYQCVIDLKEDCLRIGSTGQVVQFLPENQLPKHARLHR